MDVNAQRRAQARRTSLAARFLCAAALALATMFWAGSAPAAATAPIELLVPQGTAFAVLGYDCGGIKEHAYATGFDTSIDPAAGYPTGDVFLTTTCSAGGKGGHDFTVTAWTSDTWDLTGALLSHAVLTAAPTVDPNFVATDSSTGNEIYNTTNFNCTGAAGTVPNACLQRAPTFTPRPRVTSISASIGPASGGTTLTIAGDGFTAADGVYFGATPAASYTINSDSSITAVAPTDTSGTSPDATDVTVTSAGGSSFTSSSDRFTAYGRPTVTHVTPSSGPLGGGYYVTVKGANFVGTTVVAEGDTATAFQVIDNSTLSVYVVPGETAGDQVGITVTSPGGTSPDTAADQFIYNVPARLGLSPRGGLPRLRIRATGARFAGGEKVAVAYLTGLSAPAAAEVRICTATTTAAGAFACKGTIPGKAAAGAVGPHTIVATG